MEAPVPTTPLRITMVSDVVCPWCAVGLHGLLRALATLQAEFDVAQRRWCLDFQPFRLNPTLGPEGAEVVPYLQRKYGMSAEQVAQSQANIRERAAQVGFDFNAEARNKTWNTFDAHRLLHAAGLQDGPDADPSRSVQLALKLALLEAHFTHGESPIDPAVMRRCADRAGMDPTAVDAVVKTDIHTPAVEEEERTWRAAGIQSVPAFVIDRRHLISGGQPEAVFVDAIRRLAYLPQP